MIASGRRELLMNTPCAFQRFPRWRDPPACVKACFSIFFVVLSLTVSFSAEGCFHRQSEGKRLTTAQFAQLYADLLAQGEASRQAGHDTVFARAEADSVMRRAGVSGDQYRATVEWLNEDPARWKEVGDEASRILEKREPTRR